MPRVRMFAGPNGSGKSTAKSLLRAEWLGVYLNADDIERQLRENRRIDLAPLNPGFDASTALLAISRSGLAKDQRLSALLGEARGHGSVISLSAKLANSYFASALVEHLRGELLRLEVSHSFETVMSHRSKVEALLRARAAGFRTYLYFVATKDPDINVARVASRHRLGGHDVPVDKIRERYWRSLELLAEAVKASDRAFLFDNSGREIVFLAEIVNGSQLIPQQSMVPEWFAKYVISRLPLSA